MRPGSELGGVILEVTPQDPYDPARPGIGDLTAAQAAIIGLFASTTVRLDIPLELDPDTERRCGALIGRLRQGERERSNVALNREEVATLREAVAAALAAHPSALNGVQEFARVAHAAFSNAGLMRAAKRFDGISAEAAAELALTALGPATMPAELGKIAIIGSTPVTDANTGLPRYLTLAEVMPPYRSAAGLVMHGPLVGELASRLQATAPPAGENQ